MKLITFKPTLFPLKIIVKTTPQEPLYRWYCATPNNTITNPTTKNARAPNNWERLLVNFDQNRQTPPQSQLNERWMEYHGSKNWEGLLDPLDEGLRGEIIRYGSFVEAAYQSFDFDPSSSTYASCRYTKSTILERSGVDRCGYRVTKNLFATSSIPLPRWINKMPSWVHVQSSWIGYVAVCEDKNEISRLGRRDIVIALRGTTTCLEWLENLRATLTHCNIDDDNEGIHESMVEAGVLSLYTSGTTECPSLQNLLQKEILRLLNMYGEETVSLTFTGHSLGASLAILAAYDINTTIKQSPHLSVISFGGPRVGNRSFRHQLEKQGTKILRIVNSDDLITKVPGFFVEESDDVVHEHNVRVTHITEWIRTNVKDSRWIYANIGHELRLSSRDSLQLNSINVATCHDLKTYLDLVNGFVSSTCPFRAGAKKMLNKATTISSLK